MTGTQVLPPPRRGPAAWFRGTVEFLEHVRAEMSKVSWPTKDELLKATRMVVVLSLIIGVILGLLDRLLQLILVDGIAALAR